MALAEHPLDQARGQLRHLLPHIPKAFRVRQVVIDAFDPFLPLFPAPFSDVGIYQKLFLAPAHDTRHPGQAGRVTVLLVDLQSVPSADVIQVIHTPAVFPIIRRIDPYNGMEALPAGMDQAGHRKLQFPDQGVLLADLHAVRFY